MSSLLLSFVPMRSKRAPMHAPVSAVRVLAILVVTATLMVVSLPGAEAITRPDTLYAEHPVSSAVVEVDFPVDYLGVVFELAGAAETWHVEDATSPLRVRFRHGGAWGAWLDLEEDGAQAIGQWSSGLVSAGGADAYQVRGVPALARNARAAAINTSDGPHVVVGYRAAGSAEAVTSCKSRADWGADESLRTSNRAFAPVQMLTVHHTATDNTAAVEDPDGQIRAIYRYHTQTRGWADIGYQSLIAPDGTVYEGRWSGSDSMSCAAGGDGSDFGHETAADDSAMVTGAHVGGYNTGNYGISLLGSYVDVAPSSAARSALVEYLSELAARHALDPLGAVAYDNGTNATTADTISGHRDLVATDCPGGVLYADLPQIRFDVDTAMGGGTVPEGPVDDVAIAETTAAGSVSGTYRDTHVADGGAQALTEEESGGRPDRRRSLLEHTWTVDVTGGQTVTLAVEASSSPSADGDDFAFSYSLDGGATYADAFTFGAGSSGVMTARLPAGISGAVLVRVVDTDRTRGARALDSLNVDHLYIRSESGEGTVGDPTVDPPTEDPAAMELSATGYKVKGEQTVDLWWTGSTAVTLRRDGALIFTGQATSFTDQLHQKGGGVTYTYEVCDAVDAASCAAPVTVTF